MEPIPSPSANPVTWREDPDHQIPPLRLSDDEYARALQTFSFNCVDIVAYHSANRTIDLVQRAVHPAKGWWWFGGRLLAGEDWSVAAQRLIRRETGLELAVDRFRFVEPPLRCIWNKRQQEPVEFGADTTSLVHAFEPTSQERSQLADQLDPNEYVPGSLRAFSRDELMTAEINPVILLIFDHLFDTFSSP